MNSLLTRMRDDAGQAFVFVALTLMVLVGMAALVVDGGSWYQADRRLQTAADAAALAGAQHLPTKPTEARTVALDYAQKNYAGIPAPTVAFPDAGTIDVSAIAKAPGIFARIFDINEVTVRAQAQARLFAPAQLKDVAPVAVQKDVACIVTNPSCFGQPKTLTFDEDDVTKSKFGLLNLDREGTASASELSGWIDDGYDPVLPVNTDYPPANGEKEGPIRKSLEDASKPCTVDDERCVDGRRALLFPVFDTASASTGFHVIGWAAFVIDVVVKWTPHEHELKGHYVTFIATDLAAGNPITDLSNDFGVHVITLTK